MQSAICGLLSQAFREATTEQIKGTVAENVDDILSVIGREQVFDKAANLAKNLLAQYTADHTDKDNISKLATWKPHQRPVQTLAPIYDMLLAIIQKRPDSTDAQGRLPNSSWLNQHMHKAQCACNTIVHMLAHGADARNSGPQAALGLLFGHHLPESLLLVASTLGITSHPSSRRDMVERIHEKHEEYTGMLHKDRIKDMEEFEQRKAAYSAGLTLL